MSLITDAVYFSTILKCYCDVVLGKKIEFKFLDNLKLNETDPATYPSARKQPYSTVEHCDKDLIVSKSTDLLMLHWPIPYDIMAYDVLSNFKGNYFIFSGSFDFCGEYHFEKLLGSKWKELYRGELVTGKYVKSIENNLHLYQRLKKAKEY